VEKLNEEQVKIILKSLEFDIELNDYFYEKISNEFRYSVERFLDSFSEDSFIKNIKSIQKLFE
jgi:flagellar biosynthesis regulator FlbT